MPYYNNRAVRPIVPPDNYDDLDQDLDDDDNIDQPDQFQTARPSYRVAGTTGPGPVGNRPTQASFGAPPTIRRPLPPPSRDLSSGYSTGRAPNIPVMSAAAPSRQTRQMAPAKPRFASWLIAAGGVAAVLVVSYMVVSALVGSWQNWQDDQTYGWPRLTRLEARVGHNENGPNAKTLFIAQNLKGQVSIIEIPGGDPTQTRVIVGPQLFGKGRDLVPIRLSTEDVNGDGQADLVATVQDQKLIYINEKGNFRPITEPERAKLRVEN